MRLAPAALALAVLALAPLPFLAMAADTPSGTRTRAEGGAHTQPAVAPGAAVLSPEERMNSRYPQKVRAGDLLGLPLLDLGDRTLGFVTAVVRTPEGRVALVVPEGGWFGRGGRAVSIPIETVAILGRQIALLDIPREALPTLATWTAGTDKPIAADETIRIAITRR